MRRTGIGHRESGIGWCVALGALVLAGQVFAGTVITRDGKTHEGQVTLQPNGRLLVVPAKGGGGGQVAVELATVQDAILTLRAKPGAATRPADWQTADIGAVKQPGKLAFKDGRFVITQSGRGMALARQKEDACFFVYQKWGEENGSLIARVLYYDEPKFVRVGLMVRQGLQPDAPYIMAFRTAAPGSVGFGWRAAPGVDVGTVIPWPRGVLGASYLRITRTNGLWSISDSLDGKTWRTLREMPLELHGPDVVAGLVFSGTAPNDKPVEAALDRVSLHGVPAGSTAGGVPAGVLTTGGSLLAAKIEGLDETSVKVRRDAGGAEGGGGTVTLKDTARVHFAALNRAEAERLAKANPGVLLAKGDFIEGAFRGLRDGKVEISSVLFGLQSFLLGTEARALVLRPVATAGFEMEVVLRDGSRIRGAVRAEKDMLVIEDAALGTMRVPLDEVAELHRPGT